MIRPRGNMSERMARAKAILELKQKNAELNNAKFLKSRFYRAIKISFIVVSISTIIIWVDLFIPGRLVQDEIKGHERFKTFSSSKISGNTNRSFYLHLFLAGNNGNVRSIEIRDNENFELPKDFSPIEIEFSKILGLPKNVTIESSGMKARVTNSIFSRINLLIFTFLTILSLIILVLEQKKWNIQRIAFITFCLNIFALLKLFFYITV